MRKKKSPGLPPEVLALVARRFRVLGDPTRLAILQALFEGELPVNELCRRAGAGQANVSKHLSIMADQGILGRRKEGLCVYYRIIDDSIFALCETVCGSLAERMKKTVTQLKAIGG